VIVFFVLYDYLYFEWEYGRKYAMVSQSAKRQAGWPGVDSQQGQEIFLSSMASILAFGPTKSPVQWVLGAVSLGMKLTTHTM
jgi:hypothetical protein